MCNLLSPLIFSAAFILINTLLFFLICSGHDFKNGSYISLKVSKWTKAWRWYHYFAVFCYVCVSPCISVFFLTVGSTEQRSLGSTSSQASPASVMQFDSYTTFDWDVYLRETNSVTAPPEYYKQVYWILLKCPRLLCEHNFYDKLINF